MKFEQVVVGLDNYATGYARNLDQADISKAKKLLGYAPTHRIRDGLREAMGWYIRRLSRHA